MSPPIFIKDFCISEKKIAKNNPSKNTVSNKKLNNCIEPVMSDLVIELQGVVAENAKLQSTNKTLKSTVKELRTKYYSLMESVELNKDKFEMDLNKLQEEIKNNESHLIDNNKKCLQQQKKHIQEIKKLTAENEKLQQNIAKNEIEFMEKIKNLETEIKLLQINNDNIKVLNEEFSQKSSKYKHKLKYAVTIINDLNTMLLHCTKRPDFSHQETQTEDGRSTPVQSLQSTQSCVVQQHQYNLETENLLLSEVFFKSRAFYDNELLLFDKKESDQNLDDLQKMKVEI